VDERVEPLAIVFVSSHARNGGSERYLETLLGLLGPRWTRGVVCLEHGPLADRLAAAGYATAVIPSTGQKTSMLAAAWRLRRLLDREQPDLVHANGVKAALVAVLATAGTRVPVVWVKHDFSWDGPLARMIAARCRLVVGVSAAVTEALGSKSRVRVVPTGIPALSAQGPVADIGGVSGAGVVGVFGYLHPLKGQVELVEAVPRILEQRPGARFLLVGGEDPSVREYAAQVRSRVEELGLGASVSFLGHREDAIEVMRACDAVVVPTLGRGEGFGLVGVEAMAVERPVVGYATGALPEVVGECALLVPPGERDGLGDAVVRVLADADLRGRLVRCGSARVRERFALDRWAAGMVEAYREAA
jgi:glycosyltransferase involved in cell wall biosynthesis